MLRYQRWYHIVALLVLGGLIGIFLFGFRSSDTHETKDLGAVETSGISEDVKQNDNFRMFDTFSQTSRDPLQRTKQVQQVCSRLDDVGLVPLALPKSSYEYMYVNDEHKFIFCMMPKLACTNWKRIFLALDTSHPRRHFVINQMNSALVHTMFSKHGKTFHNYNSAEIEKRLKTYKKVVFVRDPFTRLLSAYKDKMFRNDNLVFQNIAKKIIRLKRDNSANSNESVSFLEFIRYLTDEDTHEGAYEQHWAQYHRLCQPCVVNYDFIGKIESMDDDLAHAFDFMGIKDKMESFKFPDRNVAYKNVESSKIVDDYYKQIPMRYLRRVWKYLKLDVMLFSYQKRSFLTDVA